MNRRPIRLMLDPLENRDVPAGVAFPAATFDEATAIFPLKWTSFSLNNGSAKVSSGLGSEGSNALVFSGSSNSTTRAWGKDTSAANVKVQSNVFLDSLIPTLVLSRGKQLDSATPTFYAASVSRGVTVSLYSVVNGVSTLLGTMKSNQYLSNQWVDLSLTIANDRLQVRLQRLDNGQWLNRFGDWQTSSTEAVDARDTKITGRGLVGIERPASNSGDVKVDNFRSSAARGDVTPPSVDILMRHAGKANIESSQSGVVQISTKIRDASGVLKADFLVDGLLVARREKSPFQIDLETRNFANGSHILSVRVWDKAGNSSETRLPLTFNNSIAVAPTPIPAHYSHIRYATLAYNGTILDANANQLLANSVDLVVPNSKYLNAINSVTPDTPQLIYSNVSNLYLDLLTDWLNYADTNKISRESAFYHVTQPTKFSGNSPSSISVDRFWNVQQGRDSLVSLTSASQQNKPAEIKPGIAGESLYLGYPDRFREINLSIGKSAGNSWAGVWEYPSAVDSTGKPTSWKTIKLSQDQTKSFLQSGRITFDPPSGWKAAKIAGNDSSLFYVRFRVTKGATLDSPIINQIRGRDYVSANNTTSGTIPAFDKLADRNGDGYLSDSEFSKHRSGMEARFLYESRLFYPGYGQMRFATNPGGTGVANWATDYHRRMLASQPLADGIMMDNSLGKLPNLNASVTEQTDTYGYDYSALLGQLSRAIAPKKIVANTAGGGAAAQLVDRQVAGSIEEFAIRPMEHTWSQFRSVANDISSRLSNLSANQFLVLDTYSNGGGSPTDPRTRMSALAYYYLLADPESTYLMTWGGEEPSSSWDRHWFDAIAQDIGKPNSAWTRTATGTDPADSRLSYEVFGRSYDKALVLYKPRSYAAGIGSGGIGAETATTHQLDGNYRILNSDGTLGPVTKTVTLRNAEGVVLIKA